MGEIKTTDRDRLIKLLKKDNCPSPYLCDAKCQYANLKRCYEARTADYLLANGVIVPPCKVGDKVYFDTYLHGDSVGVQSHKVINVKYVITTEPSKGGIGAEIPDYAFGKTVFLTREEAEKALKELNTDGN